MIESRAIGLLWDACRALDRVSRFIASVEYPAYAADELLRSAVERQLEVAGEALAALRRIDADAAARIPQLDRAVALRNILIHGYASIDNEIIWDITANHVPPLRAALERLLHDTS